MRSDNSQVSFDGNKGNNNASVNKRRIIVVFAMAVLGVLAAVVFSIDLAPDVNRSDSNAKEPTYITRTVGWYETMTSQQKEALCVNSTRIVLSKPGDIGSDINVGMSELGEEPHVYNLPTSAEAVVTTNNSQYASLYKLASSQFSSEDGYLQPVNRDGKQVACIPPANPQADQIIQGFELKKRIQVRGAIFREVSYNEDLVKKICATLSNDSPCANDSEWNSYSATHNIYDEFQPTKPNGFVTAPEETRPVEQDW